MQKGLKTVKLLARLAGAAAVYVLGCLEIRWKK